MDEELSAELIKLKAEVIASRRLLLMLATFMANTDREVRDGILSLIEHDISEYESILQSSSDDQGTIEVLISAFSELRLELEESVSGLF